jgi:hypothetical protein
MDSSICLPNVLGRRNRLLHDGKFDDGVLSYFIKSAIEAISRPGVE